MTAVLEKALSDVARATSVSEAARIVLPAARALAAADAATFVLRADGQCHYVDEDSIQPLWKGQRFPSDICISGWAMREKRPAIVQDIAADERIPYNIYRTTFIKSMVMVPIRPAEAVGSIGVYWAKLREPDDVLIARLQLLADACLDAVLYGRK